jgi:predicted amidohydrolase
VEAMIIDAWNIDAGEPASSAEEYGERLLKRVEHSWAEGADLVLLPEYCWLGLEPHTADVSDWFWRTFWPSQRQRFLKQGKAAVLGTAPRDGRNRAVIVSDGRELFQDKLALTPWETKFSPGSELKVWTLGDIKLAVLVCLDIEIPEWSVLLRGAEVDVILVPSATETLMGVERIGRCASARAVELGCAVVTAHLTGQCQSELIDQNVGRTALYLPSLAATAAVTRSAESTLLQEGSVRTRMEVDISLVRSCRVFTGETNPALVGADGGLPRIRLTS